MTSEELKSAEKRAEDALIEKENMSKAMTAVEAKAISTTYVSTDIRRPCALCPSIQTADSAGFSLRSYKTMLTPLQHDLRQMQGQRRILLSSANPIRR
jgi:hypothetical protein